MGNKRSNYEGVRIASASTVEIDFYYQGVRCRERLKLQPTPANLRKAARHRAAIIDAIDAGTFDYQVTFPRSKNARKFLRGTAWTTTYAPGSTPRNPRSRPAPTATIARRSRAN
ncbi:hypothetical protein A8U91_04697 [Halomonas elongata]|uniref:Min27-like integrase DNA-binding domain-containing protein n=1 Tax=Halomonas elongata TaxID=2746 RepID=A0A1B8P094_HALEL|nr:hypothetical protein A8U91_04697 [Halomonas elongata]